MIKIKERKMIISNGEENLGFVGDNNTEVREFVITDKELFDFDFKLDLKMKEYVGIVDLEKNIDADKLILKWKVKKEHLPQSGMIYAQIRAFNSNGDTWHSEKGSFWITGSINATQYFPSPLPSEFEQIEQQVTTARNETVAAKNIVLEQVNEVVENTQTVLDKTEIVMQKARKVEEDAQRVSQNTESTAESANIAAQALTDLLAMLGKNIATLTDGKLTPSQIPALSINDVFTVENTEEMLSLTAERGDVAIVMLDDNIYDCYILSADDATILSNWKKLGVSYVANAGHAQTANSAVNADRINGYRIVHMTKSQYELAVKNPDTIYLVEVE